MELIDKALVILQSWSSKFFYYSNTTENVRLSDVNTLFLAASVLLRVDQSYGALNKTTVLQFWKQNQLNLIEKCSR